MGVLTLLLIITFLFMLVTVTAVRPRRSQLSRFELTRRADNGDTAARLELERSQHLQDITGLQQVLGSVLLVIISVLSVALWGWWLGLLMAALAALLYRKLADIAFVRRYTSRLFTKHEASILEFVRRYERTLRLFQVRPRSQVPFVPASSKELAAVISRASVIIGDERAAALQKVLAMDDVKAGHIMTPRDAISSIAKKELLGPLVLNDLHKTGHSRFPVTAGDIDTIVGVLDIQDLLSVEKTRSVTVEKVMDPHCYYIHESSSLTQALQALLTARQHLLIVVNDAGETAGLLTLTDTLKAVLGRHIMTNTFALAENPQAAAQNKTDVR